MITTISARLGVGSRNISVLGVCVSALLVLSSCSGGGSSNQSPTVSLSASPNPVNSGNASTLTWSSTNTTSCTASGAWNGSLATSGSQSTGALTADTSYTITCTGSQGSASASVTVAINLPPIANNSCYTIIDNQTEVTGTLTATDPNGGTLTYEIVTQPLNGTVSTTPAGVFTYQPNGTAPRRRGMDKFTFRARDPGELPSEPATAWILNDGKVRIMPLGDSITEGITVGNSNLPPAGQRVGYRKKLYDNLANAGYPIDFVGTQSEGASAGLVDPNHEGHSGWCTTTSQEDPCNTGGGIAQNIRNNLEWFNQRPPDIVLLHIGTNDLGQGRTGAAGIATILNEIESWVASNYPVTVFLAKIIDDADPNINGDLPVPDYNDDVEQEVNNHSYKRVIVVDQHSALVYSIDESANCLTNGVCSGDMADDLHPNPKGYNKMADKWRTELTAPSNVGNKYLGLPQCQ